MKKITNIAIILLLTFQYLYSQDIILLKNGKSLKTKILMVQNELVYYRSFNDSSHDIKTIKLKNIQNVYLNEQIKPKKKISVKKDSVNSNIALKTTMENKDTTIISMQKSHEQKNTKLIKTMIPHKKRIGIGTDIFFTEKNERFTGLSIDFYFHRYFNSAIGYGYLQGNPNPYAVGTIIFPLKNTNWSVITAYQIIKLNKKTINNLEIFSEDKKIDNAFYNIFNLGIEYRDDTGLSSKLWIGAAITGASNINKYSGILMGFRIAGHI